ncbi:MAG: hypothetical protein CMJ19_17590 [Phycisphaeraceae bacterium]|nr:hypothetical protein [Phycisphaeraceae bacterium]
MAVIARGLQAQAEKKVDLASQMKVALTLPADHEASFYAHQNDMRMWQGCPDGECFEYLFPSSSNDMAEARLNSPSPNAKAKPGNTNPSRSRIWTPATNAALLNSRQPASRNSNALAGNVLCFT